MAYCWDVLPYQRLCLVDADSGTRLTCMSPNASLPRTAPRQACSQSALAIREGSRGAVLRCAHDSDGRRSGAAFCTWRGARDRRLGSGRRHPPHREPKAVLSTLRTGNAAYAPCSRCCARTGTLMAPWIDLSPDPRAHARQPLTVTDIDIGAMTGQPVGSASQGFGAASQSWEIGAVAGSAGHRLLISPEPGRRRLAPKGREHYDEDQ